MLYSSLEWFRTWWSAVRPLENNKLDSPLLLFPHHLHPTFDVLVLTLNIPMVKVPLFRNIHFRGCIHIGPSGCTSFCIHSSKDHPCSGIQVCYPPERHIPNPNKYVQMNCTPDPLLHTQLEGFIQCKRVRVRFKKTCNRPWARLLFPWVNWCHKKHHFQIQCFGNTVWLKFISLRFRIKAWVWFTVTTEGLDLTIE